MNVSYRWLRALAPTITEPPPELAHRLAMLGAPVDEVVQLGEGIAGVVIARVDEVRPHPNADRLRLCTVDAGTGETVQVVCGAANVEAGGLYPFAPVGAVLPGGVEIRRAKLRGEVSQGMLCSARELGLGRDHLGLMALDGEWQPGTPFVDALGLDDVRLLIDVTANRSDLLSHLGIARELAPGGVADLRLPAFPGAPAGAPPVRRVGAAGSTGGVQLRIEDVEACPRYMAAVLRGVRVRPSPEWLASRLRAVGLRPINNVVDATNSVLLELGQPLHAFDLAKLGDTVVIRRAAAGESIRTLDGVERTLTAEMLVIADARRPVAVAGVMGGEESEVSAETRDLLIECALFEPRTVRRAARALGLSTDASYRFERGVDPDGLPRALQRVVELIRAVAGGEPDGEDLDLYPVSIPRPTLALRPERVERVLGVALPAEALATYLRGIGFDVSGGEGGQPLRVEVPGFRPDVTREIDLIEEIARRHGYESFPEELLPFRPSVVPEDPWRPVVKRLRERLRGLGYLEARGVGFAPAGERRVPLLNPLSAEESHLRDSLVPGLLRRVEHNWGRGTRDVRLFEIGTVFLPAAAPDVLREETRVAAVLTGDRRPPHWSDQAETWDVWDLKGLLELLAADLRGAEVVPGDVATLEDFTAAETRLRLARGDVVLGGGGRAAAAALDAPAWAAPVWVLEARIPAPAEERDGSRYRPIPEFPASTRDLALVTPGEVSAAEVGAVIRQAAGPLLEGLEPFDVYAGKGLPEGARSVAWRLRYRAPDRTLTDAEVDASVGAVLEALEEGLGVRRR